MFFTYKIFLILNFVPLVQEKQCAGQWAGVELRNSKAFERKKNYSCNFVDRLSGIFLSSAVHQITGVAGTGFYLLFLCVYINCDVCVSVCMLWRGWGRYFHEKHIHPAGQRVEIYYETRKKKEVNLEKTQQTSKTERGRGIDDNRIVVMTLNMMVGMSF